MTATTVPAAIPISEARAQLTDICIAAKEHGAQTTITRNDKPVAKVVPSGSIVLTPGQVAAVRAAYDKATTTGTAGAPAAYVKVLTELGRLLDTCGERA